MRNNLGIDIEKTEKQLNDRRKTEQQICSRKNIVFKLPLPVSLNDLYEINANGKGLRLSASAKEYKSICTAELLKAKISQKFVKGERIEVYAHFYPKKTRGGSGEEHGRSPIGAHDARRLRDAAHPARRTGAGRR